MTLNPGHKFFQNHALIVFVLAALVFCAYSFVLDAPFRMFDDEVAIVNNENIKDARNIGKIFTSPFFDEKVYYRPLVSLTYMLEYRLFGLNAFFYYLDNILLHIATSLTVFFLMNFLLRDSAFAFFVACLFGLHPVQWESVANVSGRAILLCGFFYITAFWLFCFSREKQAKLCYALSLVSFTLALLAKEAAVTLPILLAAYVWFQKKSVPSLKADAGMIVPYAAVEFLYWFLRQMLGITEFFHWRTIPEAILGFMTFLRSLFTHIRLFIFPIDLHFDRTRKVFANFYQMELWGTLVIVILGALFLIKLYKKYKDESHLWFFLFWFFTGLLPVAQIWVTVGVQPGYISTAEHFLYIPSAGMFVLCVAGCRYLYGQNEKRKWFSRPILNSAVAGLLIFFFLTTVEQTMYARAEAAMFERTLKLSPDNARIRTLLALTLAKKGFFKEAEIHFQRALAVDPYNNWARIGLGKALCDQGRYWECLEQYEQITDAGKLEELLQNNLKLTYQILINKYQAMIHNDPQNPKAYFSLGVAYFKAQQIEKAAAEFKKALQFDPQYTDALFNAAVCLEALNDKGQAALFYQKAVSSQEKSELVYQSYLRLGEIFREFQEDEKAQQYFQAAEEIRQGHQGTITPVTSKL